MDDGSPKPRSLEERTLLFAQSIRSFVKALPGTIGNAEDARQLVRSSGSVAANWIEADEALSKKDFLMRAKICRKEAKESRLFLRLIERTFERHCPRRAYCGGVRVDPDFFGDHFKERRMMSSPFIPLELKFYLGFRYWDLGFLAQ